MFLGLRHPLLGLEPCGHIPPDDAQQFRAGARGPHVEPAHPATPTGEGQVLDRQGFAVLDAVGEHRHQPAAVGQRLGQRHSDQFRPGQSENGAGGRVRLAEGEVDDPPVGIPNGSQQRQTIHHGVQGRAEKCLCGCAAEVTGHAWDSGTHREETSVSPDRPEGPVGRAAQVYCRRKAGQNLRRT